MLKICSLSVVPVKHDMRGVGVVTQGGIAARADARRQATEARSQGAELISRHRPIRLWWIKNLTTNESDRSSPGNTTRMMY